jgi:hypothetical protein
VNLSTDIPLVESSDEKEVQTDKLVTNITEGRKEEAPQATSLQESKIIIPHGAPVNQQSI